MDDEVGTEPYQWAFCGEGTSDDPRWVHMSLEWDHSGGLVTDLLHPEYLPFTADSLRKKPNASRDPAGPADGERRKILAGSSPHEPVSRGWRLCPGRGVRPPARASRTAPRACFPHWEDALAGPLELFFEVSLPSPRRYRDWLRHHLDERAPIPYLSEKAAGPGSRRLEGPTKADAMLLARDTGVAVIFEAKMLSDIST
jgi:hypothetical protein